MSAETEYPELYQFFGGWFNQDWGLDVGESGDWPEVVDLFVADEGFDQARAALGELDRLLAAASDASDAELRRILDHLGSYYLPDAGRARWWLVAVRDRLAAAVDARREAR